MAIAWVQNAQGASGSSFVSSQTATLANTTNGNLIVVAAWTNTTNKYNFVRTITDGTNTYISAGAIASGSGTQEIWYAKNITGAATPTVTASFSAPTLHANIGVVEVSGLATSQPLDFYIDATIKPPGNSTISIGGLKPRTANNFVFFACGQGGVTNTYTVGSGFANLQQQGISTDTGTSATQTQINGSATVLDCKMTGAGNTTLGPVAIAVFSDTDLPPVEYPTLINNFQFVKAPDGISVTEKIR